MPDANPVRPDEPEGRSPSLEPLLDSTHASMPVFYDENRRRWPILMRIGLPAAVLAAVGIFLWVASVIALPLMPSPLLPRVQPRPTVSNLDPILNDHIHHALSFVLQKERKREEALHTVRHRAEARRKKEAALFLQALASRVAYPARPMEPVVAGFYVNWEQTSIASARRHMASLTHFLPEWLHLKGGGAAVDDPRPFVDGRLLRGTLRFSAQPDAIVTEIARSSKVPILPILNNYTKKKGQEEGAGDWDSAAVHRLVSDPLNRANMISRLRDWLVQNQMQGINIDFEQVAPGDRDGLTAFMRDLYVSLHTAGLLVTQDFEVESTSVDFAEVQRWNDWVIPMLYDQHADQSPPGSVAGVDWTEKELKKVLSMVPASKIVAGVGNHGYDWTEGSTSPENVTFQSAIIAARENQPEAVIQLAPGSLNPWFRYSETLDNGKDVRHTVWFEDAVSVFNQLTVARKMHVRGTALWYLGAEDPSLWSFYSIDKWGSDWAKIVTAGGLDSVSYHGQDQVNFEGEGELLQPMSPPGEGLRHLVLNPSTGMVSSETWVTDPQTHLPMLPSAYVVRRYGGSENNARKEVVLTFDDGPDQNFTPAILDILKANNVPAVFFVVGQQAEAHPDLVQREWNEGHEVANHTWSHPDLSQLSPEAQRLQLTMTQRIIQSVIGRSTTLFRPPYGLDIEPQTGKQVEPIQAAANMGYITVGEKNDPQDWRLFDLKPGTESMDYGRPRNYRDVVRSVVTNAYGGTIVLLHDAGGNRVNTVQALPQIISELRARGFHFTSLAQLRGLSRNRMFPPIQGNDILLVGADKYVFEVSYIFQRTLTTLFTLSILLGASRVMIFLILAVIQKSRERSRIFDPEFNPSVSVVIAAYNEEKVIVRTVQALLDSGYPDLEIVVVDDGSADGTAEVVRAAYGDSAQVVVLTKPNGGKATALNMGIVRARGEIIISLDADTLFASDTIARLVRHFRDPKVGAVAGNVRVGNANNILTKWQALEYVTSQNFDRRGYDLLNCITVVPGAVGALRRAAVVRVGGYTSDTLAEDTDLTWKLRRAGWRIANDNTAMAYTEAPERLKNLARQRFRWSFGTLQCLWKHRAALGRHGAFGTLALPSLWVFQILFPAISPFMDISVIYMLLVHNAAQVGRFYLALFVVEFIAAAIAIRMDKGDWRLLPWLFFQRFVYRQLMYYVMLKSLVTALRGTAVGWGKFERTGAAQITPTK